VTLREKERKEESLKRSKASTTLKKREKERKERE
jgi:hypothetical protein